ncbi:MAG: hypothetical protein GY842_27210, partial [bacterium]|nr:hypothetical protein [bacterium]
MENGQRSRLGHNWFEIAALLIAIGLVVRQRTPFVLAACLLTVIPIAWLWNRLSLRRVDYERRFDKLRAFPGETFEMTLRVTNRKLLPLSWLEVCDRIPTALPLTEGILIPTHTPQVSSLTTAFSLRWYERVNR